MIYMTVNTKYLEKDVRVPTNHMFSCNKYFMAGHDKEIRIKNAFYLINSKFLCKSSLIFLLLSLFTKL